MRRRYHQQSAETSAVKLIPKQAYKMQNLVTKTEKAGLGFA